MGRLGSVFGTSTSNALGDPKYWQQGVLKAPEDVVSVTGMAPGEMLARTMPAGAVVLGQGPVAGSLVVRGERGAIVSAALGSGILVLAARETGCGDEA